MKLSEFARVGDTIECDVKHPYPHTIRMHLTTVDATVHGNELMADPKSGWRLSGTEKVRFRRGPDQPEDCIRVPVGTAEQHVRPELITSIEPARGVAPDEAPSSTYEQDLWVRELFRLIEAWRDVRDGTPSKAEAWDRLWKHGHNVGPHWRARAYVSGVDVGQGGDDA